jgi:hypothetical protein
MRLSSLLLVKILLVGAYFIFSLPLLEAQKDRLVSLSVFNAGTQLPGKLFTVPVHPGLSVGMEFYYNTNPKNRLFQTAKIGFSHHRFVQNSLMLYTEFGYRRAIWKGLGAEISVGGGYIHAFPHTEIFQLENGVYQQQPGIGRSQGMGGATLGLGYQLPTQRPVRLFAAYQFYLQFPFVKQYVALLPVTALHVGAATSIHSPSKK